MYPGDPTTPGYPSYENATRTEGENIPKIPSLPISWENAKALLDRLDKEGKDGEVNVNLVNNGGFIICFPDCGGDNLCLRSLGGVVDTKVTPIWNTMAVIPGFIKDEVVVVGNHRDGTLYFLLSRCPITVAML
jgi:N-acetylated-alpha-linked acidic dipeptidase